LEPLLFFVGRFLWIDERVFFCFFKGGDGMEEKQNMKDVQYHYSYRDRDTARMCALETCRPLRMGEIIPLLYRRI
jgi:hypothetical protein